MSESDNALKKDLVASVVTAPLTDSGIGKCVLFRQQVVLAML